MSFTHEGATIIRPDLGQAVHEVMTGAESMGFVGLKLLVPFYVSASSATYPVIPAKHLFSITDTKRQASGHYNRRGDYAFEAGSYSTEEHGLEDIVDDRFANIYGSLFNYELSIANGLMMDILRNQEVRASELLFNPASFQSVAVSKAWSDPTADIKADIDAQKEAARLQGVRFNTLVLTHPTLNNIKANTKVREAVEKMFPDSAKTGKIDLAHIETYLDIPIVLAGALRDEANRKKSMNLSDIWSDEYAMLAFVASGPESDIVEPCIGRTFIWNEGERAETIVEEYYDDSRRSRVLRVRHDVCEHLLKSVEAKTSAVLTDVSKRCGLLFKNIK